MECLCLHCETTLVSLTVVVMCTSEHVVVVVLTCYYDQMRSNAMEKILIVVVVEVVVVVAICCFCSLFVVFSLPFSSFPHWAGILPIMAKDVSGTAVETQDQYILGTVCIEEDCHCILNISQDSTRG